MATITQLKNERLRALREVRRVQRAADTSIEKIERRIQTLSNRKTIIDEEAAMTFVPLWNDFRNKVNLLERQLADFIGVVTY